MLALLFWWFAVFIFWFCIMQPIHLAGIVAGCISAMLSSLLAVVANKGGTFILHPERKWLKFALTIPKKIVQDFWIAIVTLGKEILHTSTQYGEFRAVPFDEDREDGFLSERRVLFTAIISLLPNSYVIGIDQEESFILIHEIAPTSDVKDLLT